MQTPDTSRQTAALLLRRRPLKRQRPRGPLSLSYCSWSESCDLFCFWDGGSSWTTRVIRTRHPIGLPFDGQSFHDTTLYGFLARLITLRDTGYRFPDEVLARIDREIAGRFD